MDNHQLPPRSNNEGFNQSLFPDNQQQYRQPNFDNYYQAQHGENLSDASWNNYSNQPNPTQSRAMPMHNVNWAQNPNAPTHIQHQANNASINGQSHPYPRPLPQSPAAFAANGYSGYNNQPGYPYQQQQPYDPALFSNSTPDQAFKSPYPPFGNASATIAPGALNQGPPRQDVNADGQSDFLHHRQSAASTPVQNVVNYPALVAAVPKSVESGNVMIVGEDQLAAATNSRRMAAYLHVGNEAFEWPMNRGTTLPAYTPRKSRNELKKLAGDDVALLAKINKGAAKKQRVAVPRPAGTKSVGSPAETIKYERDTSSGGDSSDDDSYTSDEELENPPLPNKRPEGLKDGIEYDTIKALWRSKRRAIDAKSIRAALTDFWEIVKVIRDRWKADVSAVAEAEKNQKVGDLAVLKSRVKDQRDMIEVAFKAAQKHGHRSIVELLAENLSLVFLCYQFLLDRFKADDLNGPLARSILEVISLCTTLTQAGLEKTHLDQVLQRYVKKADAKTAFYAKRILSNAASATKEPPATSTDAKPRANGTAVRSVTAPAGTKTTSVPTAGVKRAAGQAADITATKKAATGVTKPNGASPLSKSSTAKKSAMATDAAKPATTTIAKPKPAPAKSSFFASLQSAAKKPGTSIKSGTAIATAAKPGEKKPAASNAAPKSTFSFAETMANLTKPKEEKKEVQPEKQLPPETEEEKAHRLRKEARRKLHVRFKPAGELEEIRYFTHHPEEDVGHDTNQMRDVSDVGGEGRMLKLHKDMMDLDEDDSDEETTLVEFKEPSSVDFSMIDPEERQRNYEHRGGLAKVDSPEREVREKYESSTLIVFYPDSHDIPPNPREPADPHNGEQGKPTVAFGVPDEKFAARARQRKPTTQFAPRQAQQPFNLEALFKNHQQAMPAVQPQPPVPPSQALSDILAQLSGQPLQQPQQQAPMMAAAPFVGFGGSLTPSAPPPQAAQPAVPDIGAILAQLQQQGQFAGQQPPQQPPSFYDNNDRKRTWDGEAGDEPASKKRPVPPPTVSAYRYKTRTCTYWRDGRCNKGDMCTFAHEELPE